MAITVAFGIKVAQSVCGTSILTAEFISQLNQANTEAGICGALFLNSLNQIVAFGGAGTAFALLYGNCVGIGSTSKERSKKLLKFIIGGGVLTICFSPILDISFKINEWIISKMGSDIYSFALSLEERATEVTQAMLQIDSTNSFVITLIAVAILPAVFEEYIFRGTFQPIFAKWSGNIHVGIWVSAALFSLIHFQFFGFLPRLILGAGFGYLVVASGSIWPAIAGHFINNGLAVFSAWWIGPEWVAKNMNTSDGVWTSQDWAISIGLATVLVFGITQLNKWSVWAENESKYLERGQLSDPLES